MAHKFILLKNIRVQNATAMSSYCTIGIPAVTAIGGFIHALQRNLKGIGFNFEFTKFAMLYQNVDLQTYRQNKFDNAKIIQMKHPVKKDGKLPSIILEPRCHFNLHLLISISGKIQDQKQLAKTIEHQLNKGMKLAGGDIISIDAVCFEYIYDKKSYSKLIKKLNPAFTLLERKDLIINEMTQGKDALEALLTNLAVENKCEKIFTDTENENTQLTPDVEPKFTIEWQSPKRNNIGWIIPIAVGFQGISPLHKAQNSRDSSTPHKFAECIITLGEFKMPHRLKSLDDLFWRYHQTNNDKSNTTYSLYYYSQKPNVVLDNYYD